jgi:hypothetical protein
MDQVLKALADFYNEDPEAFELPPNRIKHSQGTSLHQQAD